MNIDKGGFSQTLYNVFSFILPENFLFITSFQSNKLTCSTPPYMSRTVTYNLQIIPVQQNRTGKYVNRFINRFNYSFNYLISRYKKLKSTIAAFNPDLVICAPNGPEALFMYYALEPAFYNKKTVPYFMDDWLYHSRLKWAGGNIQNFAKRILSEHTVWMMISKNLSDILGGRYKTFPAKLLEIHNPVDVAGVNEVLPLHNRKTFTIAYAGGLWPMHFDAFLVIAKAIQLLQKKMKITLLLYTSESNWNWRKPELEKLSITYGGHVPYNQIHSTLAEADCLLVTSSFSQEWQTHSKGSVQTKITDYLKARRLIIACGPAYAANNDFVKRYNCGVCIETNNVQEAAYKLDNVLKNMQDNQACIINGLKLLKEHFSFKKVHQKLNDFLLAELL